MKHLEVVAAAIEYEHKILCLQRGQAKYPYISYKYEFPGGQVEPGEGRAEALNRELCEELDLQVKIKEEDYLLTVEHTYPDFKVTLHLFHCPVATSAFALKEHMAFQWLPVAEMQQLDWVEADKPLVELLQQKIK